MVGFWLPEPGMSSTSFMSMVYYKEVSGTSSKLVARFNKSTSLQKMELIFFKINLF